MSHRFAVRIKQGWHMLTKTVWLAFYPDSLQYSLYNWCKSKWRHSIWLIAWCQFNSLLMFSWLWKPNIVHLLSSPNKFSQLFYLNGSDYLDLAYIRLLLTCYLELVTRLCCHPGAAVCFMSLIYRNHLYQHAKVVHITAYFSWSACILFLI